MYKKCLTSVLLVLPILLVLHTEAMAQSLYRYKDSNGVTVLNNSIPAEYSTRGYEIIDGRTGTVVQKVAPVVIDASGTQVFQSPDDKILLASYSSVEEIQEHLERKLAKLNAEVANIQTDIRVLAIELERREQEMQRLKDREREIPDELTAHIATLKGSLAGLEGALQRREGDIQKTTQEYEAKARRFEVLKSADELL